MNYTQVRACTGCGWLVVFRIYSAARLWSESVSCSGGGVRTGGSELKLKELLLITGSVAITACSSAPAYQEAAAPHSESFCESWLVYDMCVQDIDADGRVDLMYFTDTDEIFFYDSIKLHQAAELRPVHPCAQPMDQPILDVGSELLQVNEETPLMSRLAIKRRLMAEQFRYMSRVRDCNRQLGLTESGGAGENYGEFDVEDDFFDEDIES